MEVLRQPTAFLCLSSGLRWLMISTQELAVGHPYLEDLLFLHHVMEAFWVHRGISKIHPCLYFSC